ncbi:MAG: Colanic acid biosysnthesis glycosyl transferase WcaI [Hydrocarboniphaga sp.]|uniref:hypothetical protein n=1 Tax=Hydrocarboniphaga sp. TaxID=2033016 RepID=UPI0026070653|nr:hypothetical protein [Hydrocarboniphaga sp.]MDB5968508.1 Colanic acid biosysnthesis glycosyl transferase WcaI [Hydrocarboniphaga sp.]
MIATAEPGTALWEAVATAETGIATPPEDAGALTEALLSLAADPGLRIRLGNNARRYAEHHLDKDAILGRFEKTLASLTQSAPSVTRPTTSDG